MANERFGLYCPKCHDAIYFCKTTGGELYTSEDEGERAKLLLARMFEHVAECYSYVPLLGVGARTPYQDFFSLIAEGRPARGLVKTLEPVRA